MVEGVLFTQAEYLNSPAKVYAANLNQLKKVAAPEKKKVAATRTVPQLFRRYQKGVKVAV
jgi:hypothetical protein